MKISKMEVTYVGHYGSDLTCVNAARVSFHKESKWEYDEWIDPPTGETVESANAKGWPVRRIQHNPHLSKGDEKLINYLAKHKHFSPFNHAFMSFRIKAPIFVARQLVKHKFMPWNEVSRRYVDEEPEFFLPDLWRAKAENVKQGSSEVGVPDGEFINSGLESLTMAVHEYEGLLEMGVAPEMARMILPQNMMTEWIWSGSLMAFSRVCKLRLDPHAQAETREIAEHITRLVPQELGVSWKALME